MYTYIDKAASLLWHRTYALLFAAVLLLPCPAMADGGSPMEILWPSTHESPMMERNHVPSDAEPPEPHVRRKGNVRFAVDLFLPPAETGERVAASEAFSGRTLSLFFFPWLEFNIIVDSETRPQPDVLLLNGRLEGADMSTFSMTVTAESYLITLQNLETATLYRVVGDTETGNGEVTEIDLTKLPPVIHSPPLVPPIE